MNAKFSVRGSPQQQRQEANFLKMQTVKKSHLAIAVFAVLCASVAALTLFPHQIPGGSYIVQKIRGKSTVSDRVAQYGTKVQSQWSPFFEKAGVTYPPRKLVLVGLKQEKRLEVYAANQDHPPRFIRSFDILRASGKMGPKLREGDLQVPEGFYHIESLNPNSAFHLALRISYPSGEDRAQAASEGRTDLGSDIMIHGSNASVGCLAMGDDVAEDLFVLAAQTGIENVEVLLCPLDFRVAQVPPDPKRPTWVQARYSQLSRRLKNLKSP
ncbi:MAG: hypothetical protein EOP06_18160 [Proteobacteria bacterium]|nr:MAG: hypothetical protein EOP06_18160 [Pseudomonadota bacterium]